MSISVVKMVDHLSPIKINLPNNVETLFSTEPSNLNHLPLADLDQFLSSEESLGILSLDLVDDGNTSTFINVPSLSPHSDIRRASLNINLRSRDENSPDLSPVPSQFNFTKILDTAFLQSSMKYSNSSFNSNSLELPSKIFVLTKSENSISSPSQSILNNAQIMTSSPGQSILNNAQIMTSSNRSRCLSQPLSNQLNIQNQKEFFWSTGRPIKNNFLANGIYCTKLTFDDDKEDLFYDSVFIEGKHLAQSMSDGSFVIDAPGILDCTPQPDWPDLDESEQDKQKSPKPNSEAVFKAIDKMFPATSQTEGFKIKTSRSDSASSKSTEAKNILQNLSEIFNNTHRSEKQKSEGRILLNNLVELLDNSQYINDGEDSGNSSNPENELIEKNSSEILNGKIADPDLFVEDEGGPEKRLSLSFRPAKSVQQTAKRRNSLTSRSTIKSNKASNIAPVKNSDKQNATVASKLKPKPLQVVSKKGPLIAVIPVEEMKKTTSSTNTSDKGQKRNSNLQVAKTSTPINEPKLKPAFTSTPRNNSWTCKPLLTRQNSFDSNNSNDGSKKSDTSKMSKLRKTSLTKEPLSTRNQLQSKFKRRNTISEGMAGNVPGRKRSNSLGKETGIMSVLPMIRQNLLKSSYYNKKSENNANLKSIEDKQVSLKVADKSVKLKKNKENLRP